MSADDFHLAAIVRCRRCAEPVADVVLGLVCDADTGEPHKPAEHEPILRRQVAPEDPALIVGLHNGTRRHTECPCAALGEVCDKPEHIYTGASPSGPRVHVADTETLVLAHIAADSIPAWCDACGHDRPVDLRELRRRIPRRPDIDGVTAPVKLRTVTQRRPTRR